MTLSERLTAADAAMRQTLTASQSRIVDYTARWLSQSGIEADALRCGELVPDFALADGGGRIVRMSDLLDRGPAVVLFFCGGWCPLCSIVLAAYAGVVPVIAEAGGALVAISPEAPQTRDAPVAGQGAVPDRLYDPGGKVCRLFGLRYALPGPLDAVYRARGIDVAARNAAREAFLPLPASYVIDGKGMVSKAAVSPDHLGHAEPEALVHAVRALAAAEGVPGNARR